MSVVGIGIDIVEIKRFRRAWKKFGKSFLNKVYEEEEVTYCLKMKSPALHLAARLAAKEAIVKALGTGMKGVSWKDFVIDKKASGYPYVRLSPKAKRQLKRRRGSKIWISLSHTEHWAVAQAIIL